MVRKHLKEINKHILDYLITQFEICLEVFGHGFDEISRAKSSIQDCFVLVSPQETGVTTIVTNEQNEW